VVALLQNRGFRYLLAGQFLSLVAPWCQRTMVLIWVYALTKSGTGVSLMGLSEALPLLLLSPVAGVFVDRWDRGRTMTLVVLLQAVLLLPLLLVQGASGFWLILVVTLAISAASQFFQPAAAAALPSIVAPESLGQANGLLQISNSVVPIIAPGVAALLYQALGPQKEVLLLGLIYLSAMPFLARVPAPRPDQATRAGLTFLREMRAGLAYVRQSRLIRSIMVVVFIALLGVGGLSVLDVVFVTRALHLRTEDVGLLLTAMGVGQLCGGLLVSALSKRLTRFYHLLLGTSILLMGVGTAAYSQMPTLQTAAAALFVSGIILPFLLVAFITLVQLTTDNAYMGRVMSLVTMCMSVASILSLTASGALTDLFGVRQVIAGGGAILVISGVVGLLVVRSGATLRPAGEGGDSVDGVTPGEATHEPMAVGAGE
jgi:predicted MFS family arabinose efflux permease